MIQIPKIDFKPYLEIVLRRKWWIIVSFITVVMVGLLYYKTAPKVYRASTLILVEPQKVSDSYVESAVTGTIESRMRTITQQVYSRTNLENLVDEFDLVRKAEETKGGMIARVKKFWNRDKLSPNDKEVLEKMVLVEKLRGYVNVRLHGGTRGGQSSFEISINWYDPEEAAEVVNFIANKFIEENLNVREEITMGTTDFLEREASRMRFELETKEKEVDAFKRRHMGSLPDQLQSNLNILNQLREELSTLENRLDLEKQTALMLENQLRQIKASSGPHDLSVFGKADSSTKSINSRIEDLEDQLKKLRSRYTDNYPAVIVLKKEIEFARNEMEKQNSTEPYALEASRARIVETPVGPGSVMISQLDLAKSRIQSYENQISKVKEQIVAYRERVEGTSKVELAMTNLLRDYETIRNRYDDLLSKSLGARMAEELERRQKGEQFRIIDRAVVPVKPVSPDLKKIMLLAIMAGLALGGGLGYAREIMDPCFYDPEEIEPALHTNVMVSLPVVDFKRSGQKEKNDNVKRLDDKGR